MHAISKVKVYQKACFPRKYSEAQQEKWQQYALIFSHPQMKKGTHACTKSCSSLNFTQTVLNIQVAGSLKTGAGRHKIVQVVYKQLWAI